MYKNGARVGLKQYGQMLARTKSAQAYNIGTLTQAEAGGVTWYEILDGPFCGLTSHNDTTLANGLLVGKQDALAWPISHPNCRRSFAPRPDIKNRSEARRAPSVITL